MSGGGFLSFYLSIYSIESILFYCFLYYTFLYYSILFYSIVNNESAFFVANGVSNEMSDFPLWRLNFWVLGKYDFQAEFFAAFLMVS